MNVTNVLLPRGWKMECSRCRNLPKELKEIDEKGPEVWNNVFLCGFDKIKELTAQNKQDKNISDKLEEIDVYFKMLLKGVIDYYKVEIRHLEEDKRDLEKILKHHGLAGYQLVAGACCCKQE